MVKRAHLVIVLVLIITTSVFAKKDPAVEARKAYGEQVSREIELSGWANCSGNTGCVVTVGHFPCGVICTPGRRVGLRVWLWDATAEATARFIQQEMEPRKAKLKSLGFEGVEIRGIQSGTNFPKGVANLPLQ